MATIRIELVRSQGSFLQINSPSHPLHIDQNRPIALRVDDGFLELRRNVGRVRSQEDKLLMGKGQRTWYKFHA
jgi:hypothetical protein